MSKIDPHAIRTNTAARLIAHYCKEGKRRNFLFPKWLGYLGPSSFFAFLVGEFYPLGEDEKWSVTTELLRKWRPGTLEEFYPYPVLRMLEHFPWEERQKIYKILKEHYGIRVYFDGSSFCIG